jgi:putative PIN family toxin of toxin-antitoxin system
LKVVLDTSVLIAAFYKPLYGPSFSRDVYDYLVDEEQVFVSKEIMHEFKDKGAKKLKLSHQESSELESLLLKKLCLKEIKRSEINLPKGLLLRDKNDLHILELAVLVEADLILSWDKDLLTLKGVGNTKILTPREFWDSL